MTAPAPPTITHLALNAFEYFLFHLAYYLVNPTQAKLLQMQPNQQPANDCLFSVVFEHYLKVGCVFFHFAKTLSFFPFFLFLSFFSPSSSFPSFIFLFSFLFLFLFLVFSPIYASDFQSWWHQPQFFFRYFCQPARRWNKVSLLFPPTPPLAVGPPRPRAVPSSLHDPLLRPLQPRPQPRRPSNPDCSNRISAPVPTLAVSGEEGEVGVRGRRISHPKCSSVYYVTSSLFFLDQIRRRFMDWRTKMTVAYSGKVGVPRHFCPSSSSFGNWYDIIGWVETCVGSNIKFIILFFAPLIRLNQNEIDGDNTITPATTPVILPS